MEEKRNELVGLILLVLPAFLLLLLSRMIEPLRLAFSDITWVPYLAYTGAFAAGWFLRRLSGVRKDHEWQRAKAMNDLKKHYDKEEKGMWTREAAVSTDLSLEAQSAMQGSVGKLVKAKTTTEIERDHDKDPDQVNMLIESHHVAKATRRVSGDESFDEEVVDSTIGAIRRRGSMDRFFDWVSKRFRDKDAQKVRIEAKQALLSSRAEQDPVETVDLSKVHQKNEAARLNVEVSSSQQEVPQQSVQHPPPQPIEEEAPAPVAQQPVAATGQSIEEMAGLVSPSSTTVQGSAVQQSSFAVSRCQCGFSNQPNERFCVNCGNEL